MARAEALSARDIVGFGLFAATTTWNAGNLGPVASELASSLDASLAAVGLAAGTVFFVGLSIAKLVVAPVAKRIGTQHAARLALLCATVGNLIVAVSPDYAGLVAGRLITGLSLGFVLSIGPVLARQVGGIRLLGIFGAAVTIGTAGALLVGGLLRAAGVDWRVDFVISAALPLVALMLLPRARPAELPSGSIIAIARRSVRRLAAWRLELLFTTALGVPYILGMWLVPFLTRDSGFSAALAGLMGFALYGLAAVFRPEGAHLDADGRSMAALAGVAPIVAAGGLVIVALAGSVPLLVVGIALAGAGFAVPYATMYGEAGRLFPGAQIAAVSLFSLGGNVLPLVITPSVGGAIEHDNGELAILILAAIPLLAGLVNLRPAAPRE